MKSTGTRAEQSESRIRIHRHSAADNYTQIPNETLRDQDLSWGARGLLSYMLSFPPDWEISERNLIGASPVGRDGVRSIVRELESFGFLRRTLIRGAGGKVIHSRWDVWALRQTECPSTEKPSTATTRSQTGELPLTGKPSTGKRPRTGKPRTAKPSTEKPSDLQRRSLQTHSRNKHDQPNSPQSSATADPGREPQQQTLPVPITSRKTLPPKTEDPAMAALVVKTWNDHKPQAWPAMKLLGPKRWEVVVEMSRTLGGFQQFIDAMPIALTAAARDSWWNSRPIDWSNFMGRGARSLKDHFLRFYEQGSDPQATATAAAGISSWAQRMMASFGCEQAATTTEPINITEFSQC